MSSLDHLIVFNCPKCGTPFSFFNFEKDEITNKDRIICVGCGENYSISGEGFSITKTTSQEEEDAS